MVKGYQYGLFDPRTYLSRGLTAGEKGTHWLSTFFYQAVGLPQYTGHVKGLATLISRHRLIEDLLKVGGVSYLINQKIIKNL